MGSKVTKSDGDAYVRKSYHWDRDDSSDSVEFLEKENGASEMIANIIKTAEIEIITESIFEYHIWKRSIASKYDTSPTMEIIGIPIPKDRLELSHSKTPKAIAAELWNEGLFKNSDVIKRNRNARMKKILGDYTPDEHWKMLCFFADERFVRSPDDANALNAWHPWDTVKDWEDKVISHRNQGNMTSVYGIVGVYVRKTIVSKPDMYLIPRRTYEIR